MRTCAICNLQKSDYVSFAHRRHVFCSDCIAEDVSSVLPRKNWLMAGSPALHRYSVHPFVETSKSVVEYIPTWLDHYFLREGRWSTFEKRLLLELRQPVVHLLINLAHSPFYQPDDYDKVMRYLDVRQIPFTILTSDIRFIGSTDRIQYFNVYEALFKQIDPRAVDFTASYSFESDTMFNELHELLLLTLLSEKGWLSKGRGRYNKALATEARKHFMNDWLVLNTVSPNRKQRLLRAFNQLQLPSSSPGEGRIELVYSPHTPRKHDGIVSIPLGFYRAVAKGKPFVISGPPTLLSHLSSMGYNTFEDRTGVYNLNSNQDRVFDRIERTVNALGQIIDTDIDPVLTKQNLERLYADDVRKITI